MADITTIGRYQVKSIIGRGGMATVYRAADPTGGRDVAIKLMAGELALDEQFHRRFRREADILRQLRHPGIVGILDNGEHDGRPWLAMPYLGGGTLADRLDRGPLPPADIAALLPTLAAALDHAHSQGVIHRDVKPSNILFDDDGRPLLTDFGIVKVLDELHTLTRQSMLLGTPGYISPEQLRGVEKLDGRSDVYALGVVVFEMLTGRLPFVADSPMAVALQQVSATPPRLRKIDPALAAGWQPIIDRALAKKRDDRYPTAGALAAAVVAVAAPGPPARRSISAPAAVGAAALVVALLAGGAFLLRPPGLPEPPATTTATAGAPATTLATRPTSTLAAPVAAPTGSGTLVAVVAPASATAGTTGAPAGPPRARLTTDTLLRTGPGAVYDAVAELAAGDEVEVIGRDTVWAWYALRLDDGREGWAPRVALEFLNVTPAQVAVAATIPAARPTTATLPAVVAPPTVAPPAFVTAIIPPTLRPTTPPTAASQPTTPPQPATEEPEPPTTEPPTAAVPPTVAVPPTAAVP